MINLKTLCLAGFLTAAISLQGQSPLNRYIQEGLKSNLVLQQQNLSLQQAQQSLKIARSYFMPSVNLLMDYTSGDGGRSIAIPVGDLLNPVYASLNQLTQSDEFPQIPNVEQNFFPKNFYDAKVRTSIPLINTDLYINKTIRQQQVTLKGYEVELYQRQLVEEIKVAYFNFASARAAVRIHESALALVTKNVEVNKSLLENGKSLPANYLRAKSEAEHVKADLNSAENVASNARKYFNFLLNRDLDSDIDTDYPFFDEALLTDTTAVSISKREELKILQQAREINQSSLQMNKLSRLPKVNAFLDLGSQASDWQYNDNSRYYLAGVQFSMPLFQGFRNNMNIRQSSLEIQKTQYNLTNTSKQLQMAAEIAKNDLRTTLRNYEAAREQLKSAMSYFRLIDKGYQQGVNSLIEFLDARNQLTLSQLQQNLQQFKVLIAYAKLERETASYTFEN